jgi:hypothetical protein
MKLKGHSYVFPKDKPVDAVIIDEELNAVIYCSGDKQFHSVVASGEICKALEDNLKKDINKLVDYSKSPSVEKKRAITAKISSLLQTLNYDVHLKIKASSPSTAPEIFLELLLVLGDTAQLYHIGDIRTYFCQKGNLYPPLIDEHNSSVERKEMPFTLVYGMGVAPSVEVDVREYPILASDRFVMFNRKAYQKLSAVKLKAMVVDQKIASLTETIAGELNSQGFNEPYSIVGVEVLAPLSNAPVIKKSQRPPPAPVGQTLFERFEIIQKSILFSGLTQNEQFKVLSVASIKQLNEGEYLIRYNAKENDLYFVLDGQLEIQKKGIKKALIEAGQILGEVAAFTDVPRSADAIVTRATSIMVLRHDELMSLLDADMVLANKIYKAVVKELVNKIGKPD